MIPTKWQKASLGLVIISLVLLGLLVFSRVSQELQQPCGLIGKARGSGCIRSFGGSYHHFLNGNAIFFLPNNEAVVREDGRYIKIQPIEQAIGSSSIATFEHPSDVTATSLSPDGSLIATCLQNEKTDAPEIWVWDIASETLLHQQPVQLENCDMDIAFSPDNSLISLVGNDLSGVELWDTKDWSKRTITDKIVAVAFSPDSKTIATAGESADKTITQWNLSDLQPSRIFQYERGYFRSLEFSADGRLLAGSNPPEESIYIWEADSGKLLHVLQLPGHNLWNIRFSPEGDLLASGSYTQDTKEGYVYIWEVKYGSFVHRIKIGDVSSSPLTLDFSPDGKLLAIGATDHAFIFNRIP